MMKDISEILEKKIFQDIKQGTEIEGKWGDYNYVERMCSSTGTFTTEYILTFLDTLNHLGGEIRSKYFLSTAYRALRDSLNNCEHVYKHLSSKKPYIEQLEKQDLPRTHELIQNTSKDLNEPEIARSLSIEKLYADLEDQGRKSLIELSNPIKPLDGEADLTKYINNRLHLLFEKHKDKNVAQEREILKEIRTIFPNQYFKPGLKAILQYQEENNTYLQSPRFVKNILRPYYLADVKISDYHDFGAYKQPIYQNDELLCVRENPDFAVTRNIVHAYLDEIEMYKTLNSLNPDFKEIDIAYNFKERKKEYLDIIELKKSRDIAEKEAAEILRKVDNLVK